MAGLSGSRWAPASHRTTANTWESIPYITNNHQSTQTNNPRPQLTKPQKELLTRHTDLQRFRKLLRRLKWKSRTLLFSHHRALHEQIQTDVGSLSFPLHPGEAEMMFKIDFFEFYVLLERVLVHLLGSFGYLVTRTVKGYDPPTPSTNNTTHKGDEAKSTEPKSLREQLMEAHNARALVGDSQAFHGQSHRFHANVLSALDLSSNPLYPILGTGTVRDYLGIAKEFRNRWKDAEEKAADQIEDGLVGSRYEAMLRELKIEEMLAAILIAIERAVPIAEDEVAKFAGSVGAADLRAVEMEMELDLESGGKEPWEAMPDAMDWSSSAGMDIG